MIIRPFKMKVSPKQGEEIINFLKENGINPLLNCSNPFEFILYNGLSNGYITLTDKWRYDKYPEKDEITYNDFVVRYIRLSKIKKLKNVS